MGFFFNRLERASTHPIWGVLLFCAILWGGFQIIFTIGAYPINSLSSLLEILRNAIHSEFSPSFLRSLVADALLSGVATTLFFVPQVFLLFLFLLVLQRSGYLMRVGKLLDAALVRVGMTGESFVPFLMGFGCNVPAITAARLIGDQKVKIITVLSIPFASCSARLPVYSLFISAFFPLAWHGVILFLLYTTGVVVALTLSLLLRAVLPSAMPERRYSVLPFRIPSMGPIVRSALRQTLHFIEKIGIVIVPMTMLVWVLFSFPMQGETAPPIEQSYGAAIGRTITPILEPIGFDWRISTIVLSAIAAKESAISTLGTMYALSHNDTTGLISSLRTDPSFSPAKALSLLVFILLSIPCISTIVAIQSVLGWKWMSVSIAVSLGSAWGAAWTVYQVSSLF